MESLSLTEKKRHYLPENFNIDAWDSLEPYFKDLLNRPIKNQEELRKWFQDRSELESVISEDLGWRYIRMTCDTGNEKYQNDFTYFISEIEPKIAPYSNKLNDKAINSPFIHEFTDSAYKIMIRNIEKELKIYREENIPLITELQNLSKDFNAVAGAQSVEIDGKELTLQQAAVILQSTDRSRREAAWNKISERRFRDKDKLNEIYNKQIDLRHKIARNAEFNNYRDYMFTAMGRFDYTPEDCFDFHNSVKETIPSILNKLAEERKAQLDVDTFRPWDKAVDPEGKEALKPFTSPEELTEKTIECFNRLDPFLGDCIATLRNMKHLDLASRKGKAPGGYNYPLAETGVPFIFMNATSTFRDMITLLHEGGHAVHSIVTRDLELHDFKNTPSEIAELASMSMELITMDHWDLFFDNEDSLKRAKREQLTQVLETLPWVATIDKFQHWIYENPEHTTEERKQSWLSIFDDYSDDITSWDALEHYKSHLWQKQLHLYEVPFYYIEYGFAQLGAIALWKNYKENNKKGLEDYLQALRLGYTKSIPEVYEAANIKFDFSKAYISELTAFVNRELEKVK